MPNTILLKGRGVQKERAAGGTITPGHLVTLNSSNQVVVHNSAGGNVIPAFALENEDIGNDLNVNYTSAEQVRYILPERGAEIYGLVPANAAAIVIGDLLASNGDGTVKKLTSQTQPDQDGLYDIATLLLSVTAEKFKTTTTALYKLGGAQYSKGATDNLTFSAGHIVSANKFGVILIQINAAGTISTKVPGATQSYNDAPSALAALPAVDAGNVALGYIAIANNAGDWTANTDDMTNGSDLTTATFVDAAEVALTPTAVVQEGIVGRALVAIDNAAVGTPARITLEVL
jgi:hypothetical protein